MYFLGGELLDPLIVVPNQSSQLCRYRHNWLNMAEIEINVLTLQCFQRCIPDRATMVREVRAWQDNRNGAAKPIEWRFRAEDARIKLKSLYPPIQ